MISALRRRLVGGVGIRRIICALATFEGYVELGVRHGVGNLDVAVSNLQQAESRDLGLGRILRPVAATLGVTHQVGVELIRGDLAQVQRAITFPAP
ncbi:MAG: hypothetical protein ABI633_03605 [Burkholderiales bacterium]